MFAGFCSVYDSQYGDYAVVYELTGYHPFPQLYTLQCNWRQILKKYFTGIAVALISLATNKNYYNHQTEIIKIYTQASYSTHILRITGQEFITLYSMIFSCTSNNYLY